MFKLVKHKKPGKYDLPGSYVGAVMGHCESPPNWRIVMFDPKKQVYYRSKLTSECDKNMTTIHEDHCYTHREIRDLIERKSWVLITHKE